MTPPPLSTPPPATAGGTSPRRARGVLACGDLLESGGGVIPLAAAPQVSWQVLHAPVRKAFPRDLQALAGFVLSAEGIAGPVELTVNFPTAEHIRALNRRFRGVDRPTDVMAFQYAPAPALEGDIAINLALARRQAREQRHAVAREIRILLIHGILHLLGYTDYSPRPRRRMFRRQSALLRAWEGRSIR